MRHVALLRGINVGGASIIRMAEQQRAGTRPTRGAPRIGGMMTLRNLDTTPKLAELRRG